MRQILQLIDQPNRFGIGMYFHIYSVYTIRVFISNTHILGSRKINVAKMFT